ncbi:ATP-dependent DNA helicase pif1-like [Diabrotica undecimpunctata]|uniref:ATP-dependent DNA helicase pif1-like n=1 Tax=Diabrotica undecimpunctata TaxID=50387 RepID=UPI003B63B768
MARLRASQSREQSEAARETARLAMQNRRANNRRQQIDNLRRRTRYLADLNRAAFRYDCSNDYSLHPSVCIGQMDVVCEYCGALKFSGETPGLCCLNGKVKLPVLTPPQKVFITQLILSERALEALNRTLKDLRNDSRCFGGAMILLSGDFRQILPVIPRSTAVNEINACLKSSNLWRYVKKLQLTTNMRVTLLNDTSAENFSEQLLTIGNGQVLVDELSGLISFLNHFCNFVSSKDELINNVFPNIISNYKNNEWLSERAILAAKNKDVDDLNYIIQNKIIGTMHSFKSIDCVSNEDEATNYPIEFLNSLDVPGLPPHNLRLKVGSVVIMLRYINQPKLCNGTRLVVSKLINNVIYATILIGKFKGEEVLIPRIPMIPTDMPFEFKRLQFPIRLAFAMTINKSQGQSLKVCGLNLEHSCFSHGQLYVACSRVGRPSALFVFAPDNKTKNVVYHKVLK